MLKFIDKDKQPKSVNFSKLLIAILIKHDFKSMGDLQMKTLFLGMMHFQDEYNYDIKRVEKCERPLHACPDGRVVPFCTFNVIPELYRDKVQRAVRDTEQGVGGARILAGATRPTSTEGTCRSLSRGRSTSGPTAAS